MADSSLDDFFAKKDKSKKKGKSKLTPADILPKQQDDNQYGDARKKEKKKKEKEKQTTNGDENKTSTKNKEEDEEEWADFEQEMEKDYSGLRIQSIKISKETDGLEEENKENEENEDGEECDRKDKVSGPWNTQTQHSSTPLQATVLQEEKKVEKPSAEEPASEPPKTGKYVPPSVRAAAAAGASNDPIRAAPLRRKKTAPNIQSEEDFPTLGGGPGGPTNTNFDRVQSGGRQMETSNKGNLQLSLGNKYAALQE